jgi:rod shape determining protein RodA
MSFFQIDRRSISNFDFGLVFLVIVVNVIGIINLSSAAAGSSLWKTQLTWFGIGMGAMFFTLLIDYTRFERLAPFIYVATLILLVGVLFFGKKVGGARSWYDLGFGSLQPSEFMKISLILTISRIYHRDTHLKPWGIRDLVLPGILLGLPVLAILREPDMGTAMVVLFVCGTMFLFAGIRRAILVVVIIAMITGMVTFNIWKRVLEPHQISRIETFIHPEKDPLGAGYNALQSKIAIGSGGFTGKGFKNGNVHMLRFLPEQQTDFVFSVWAEEWGFLSVSFVLFLLFLIVFKGLRAGHVAKDRFGLMITVGCSALLFWHIFINISMVVGIFPVIGVPLPFMSYGGSNLLTFMIAIGLILNVRMRKYFF